MSSCASMPPGSSAGQQPREPINEPKFEGPWAAEFEDAYRTALSEDHRRALADGVVSEAEFAEVQNDFLECMRATGISITADNPGGGYDYTVPAGMGGDTSQEIDIRCAHESGESTVGALYHAIGKNPENLDEAKILAQCLVDRGLVEKGYNAARYNSQPVVYDDLIDQNIDNFKRTDECIQDPLGILAARE
ncbi:hypothetical protein [Mycetocola spongiae]|uniref:hypothetical protein n=1 Tax=Mycetocola spongiae TaxID=2859226 RepID=UPI001CF1777C|nr:hypothetical protein [Mycetocola spongiae]UCR90073.1 hypothetical protein KXZ72_05250 [Mycetocola spongiae]